MELEKKTERGRHPYRHNEFRFLSMTPAEDAKQSIVMPRRKSPCSRTTVTSKTQESSFAQLVDNDDDDNFSQTTREAEYEDDEMEDDDDSYDDDTLSIGTSTVANSTICTSTLRFEFLDLENQEEQPTTIFRRQNHHRQQLPPTLEGLPKMELTTTVQEGITKDVVRAFMEDYYTDFNNCIDHYSKACWEAFFDAKYDRERYIYIRPSGNPLDADSFCKFMTGGNLKLLRVTLISLDDIWILAGGLAAIVVYTADQDFLFKGTMNRDRCINTAVIEEVNGECKIIQEQRSTGTPRPTQGRWTC